MAVDGAHPSPSPGPEPGPPLAAYDAESLARCWRGASAYCLTAAILLLTFAALDRTRFPDAAATLLLVRALGAAALGFLLVLLQTRFGVRHPRALGVVAAALMGAIEQLLALAAEGALQGRALVTLGAESPINLGATFAMLGVAVLIPWSPVWSAFASLLVIGEYVAAAVITGRATGPPFDDKLMLFASAGVVAVVITAVLEQRRWREFFQTWALAAAHREAREREKRYRSVVETAGSVIIVLGPAGSVTEFNREAERVLGWPQAAVVGRDLLTSLVAEGSRATVATDIGKALAGEPTGAFEARMLARDGSERVMACGTRRLVDDDGRAVGVVLCAQDISDRKQAEDARLALERRLGEAQKLESLGVLAGGIAHDFNNLLVSVLGNASLALGELPPGAPTRQSVQRIEHAARRGSELTRQLLAYAGKGTVALARVDVNALIAETSDLLHVSTANRAVMTYDLTPNLPAVEADPTQIRQVLMNLVINASEAIGDADGTITVRTGVVELGADALRDTQHAPEAAPGPHVCIEVCDTGCGIDTATAARVFDPFFSTKFTGRGLGLATVLGVVRGHRGALALTSTPGSGTTVRIYLPSAGAPARAEPRPAPAAPPAGEGREGRTVLLVDDEEDVRVVTAHMLERLGCSVLQAGDGREGVQVFREHARMIDAVIVDLTLPRLSGDRVFREIRTIRPDACVILMSGYSDEKATGGLAEAGLAGFLRKPFSVGDLEKALGEVAREGD